MAGRNWLRARLVGLVLVLTLAPSALLVVLGWRLFREDRDAELRTVRERREYAAARVGSALERAFHQIETRLSESAGADLLPHLAQVSDAAVVTMHDGMIEVRPADRLAYLPNTMNWIDTSGTFSRGEFLEYRNKDPREAINWYREAARRAEAGDKAGALLRLARALRRDGKADEALATYSSVSRLPVSVDGVPTQLLARWMRCDLLDALGRRSELRREAVGLLAELRRGGWVIGRAAYEVHLTDAARWAGLQEAPPPTGSELLARAVDDVLRQPQRAADDSTAHDDRRVVATEDGVGAAVVRTEALRTIAFVALPSYVRREWLKGEQPWLAREHLAVMLQSPAQRDPGATAAHLRAADSGLPWTIAVASTDVAAELARLTARRTLWLTALAALAALVLAGTAVAARAVSSELAVARLQSDFVSAVSHEFRTPLTSLRQIGEVLQDARVNTEERRQDYYGALVRQTERLQRLVEALLDFGRTEAGAVKYKREPVAIDQLVAAVAAEFRDELLARAEAVHVHVTTEPVMALADREALSNAVRNLLDNAIKYSPGAHEAWVEVRPDGDGVAISVRDRGMGIPHREQRDIFRKFTRGDRATSQRIRGTGIGLAIVHHVVKGHGGRIRLASQPDAGSTFTIWLPGNGAREGTRDLTGGDPVAASSRPAGRMS